MMPYVFTAANWVTGFAETDKQVSSCSDDVYPGAGWCRAQVGQAKMHEARADGLFDVLMLSEYLAQLYTEQQPAEPATEQAAAVDPPGTAGYWLGAVLLIAVVVAGLAWNHYKPQLLLWPAQKEESTAKAQYVLLDQSNHIGLDDSFTCNQGEDSFCSEASSGSQ